MKTPRDRQAADRTATGGGGVCICLSLPPQPRDITDIPGEGTFCLHQHVSVYCSDSPSVEKAHCGSDTLWKCGIRGEGAILFSLERHYFKLVPNGLVYDRPLGDSSLPCSLPAHTILGASDCVHVICRDRTMDSQGKN
jgi:hypothetical protein